MIFKVLKLTLALLVNYATGILLAVVRRGIKVQYALRDMEPPEVDNEAL